MNLTLLNLFYFCLIAAFFFFILLSVFILLTTNPYPVINRSEEEKYFLDNASGKKHLFPSNTEDASVSLSVVVPAYNEEDRLPPMLSECLEYLESRSRQDKTFSFEVIIVSDGSTDHTVAVAQKYSNQYGCDKVRVLDLKPNRGKGGAVQLGVLSSRGKRILFADADGATKFSDLTKLEAEMDQGKDVVCGSRAHLEEEAIATRSLFRTILMLGFHTAVYILAVRTICDTQCGFKLLSRNSAVSLFRSLHVKRWAFDVELLFIAEKLKMRIAEVAVTWHEIDGSKIVPVLSWLQMGKDLVMIWLRYQLGAWRIAADKVK